MKNPNENFRFRAYLDGLVKGTWDGMTNVEIAKTVGVTEQTLYRWNRREIDWIHVRDARKDYFAKDEIEVDRAMLKKAKAGDARAADLVYRKVFGWVPAQSNINLGEESADSELKKRAAEIRDAILKSNAGVGENQPGISEA